MSKKYTDQTINIDSLRHFLSRAESIFLFLALTCAFTILLVVFGQPTSLTEFTSQNTTLTPLGQIAIGFTAGFVSLTFSRILLFFVNRVVELQTVACGIWIIAEMLLCVSVISLVLWAVGGGGTVQLAPLVADVVLGFVAVLLIPYVITFLAHRLYESRQEIYRLRNVIEKQGPTQAHNNDLIVNFYDKGGRLAFSTKNSNILYIEAADNYSNIHYLNDGKEDTFILHNSLKEVERRFTDSSLIRCHRGYMVNVENVKVMKKDSSGLLLELNQTTKMIPVSKSFAEPVTQYFAYNTNMVLPNE